MNPAVPFLAGQHLRRHSTALVLLGLLAGVVAAITGGTLAVAQRTATAYDRLVDRIGADAVVTAIVDPFEAGDEILDLDGVHDGWSSTFTAAQLRGGDLIYVGLLSGEQPPQGVLDLPLVAGRQPDPDDPTEVLVVERLALDADLAVGAVLPVSLVTREEQTAWDTGFGEPDGPDVDLEVVGIVRSPIPTDAVPPVLATPAFHRAYAATTGVGRVVWADLADGAGGLDAFATALSTFEAAHERPPGYETFPEVDALYPARLSGAVGSTASVLVWGLGALAVTAGVAGLLVLTQAFARHHDVDAGDQLVERALGLTRRERSFARAIAAGPAALVAAIGAMAGVLVAGLVEPLGGLDLLEPNPGWAPNVAVAVVAGATIAVAVLVTAAITAASAARRLERHVAPARPSRLATLAARGNRISATVGARFALEPGRGTRAVPVRSAIAGVAITAAGAAATLVFATGLDRLVHSPARWGAIADLQVSDVDAEESDTFLADDRFEGAALAHNTAIDIAGAPVTSYGLDQLRGEVTWQVLEGRLPAGDAEVLLGTRLARRLGAGVGDSVESRTGPLHVVGIGLGPAASGELLGDAALFTPAALADRADGATYDELYLRVADRGDVATVVAEYSQSFEITPAERPPEVEDLVRIDRLPLVLGVLLTGLGLAGLANGVVVGSRRRSQAIAVLRTIGFTPGDAFRSIVAMAIVCAGIGTAIGIPVGTAIGRLVWRATAEGVAVAGDPLVPATVALVVPAVLAIAVVIALGPAREVARRRPAQLLRGA